MPSPYAGNPANDAPTVQLPTDGDNWSASVINTPSESFADSLAYLRGNLNRASGNWRGVNLWTAAIGLGSTFSLQSRPVWSPIHNAWIAVFVSSATSPPTQYIGISGDGVSWQIPYASYGASETYTVFGCLTGKPDGTIILFGQVVGSPVTANIQYKFTLGGTLTTAGSATFSNPGAGLAYSGGWHQAGVWVVWKGGATGVSPWYSTDGLSYSSAVTWSPPSGFTIHDRASVFYTVGAATAIVLFPSGTTVVSYCMATIDGENWFQEAMPSLSAGESVVGASVDTFTGTIYLCTSTGSTTKVWSSTVLGTWTLVSTISHQAFAFAVNGRELVVWIGFGGTPGTLNAGYGAITSTDGGTTWRGPTARTLTSPSTVNFGLWSGGGQFLYTNTLEFDASQVVGPPAVLGF